MKKTIVLFAIYSLTVFAFTAYATDSPAKGPSSAVPPVTVLHDDKGDYVVDEPFPQWVKEDVTPENSKTLTICDEAGKALIPEWAAPLPVEPVRCVTARPGGKELWAATADGLIFLDLEGRNKLYFAGLRWLPDNDVISVSVTDSGDALVHTAKGDCVVARRMMTLEQKALYFERVVRERHDREGWVSDSVLTRPNDISSSQLTDDDNDGQWTEMYLAAESFRYAETHDPDALAAARKSYRAMKRLLTVSPVKGYVARSVLPANKCPGRDPENWRMLPSGDFCWKTDTSKDEIIGHYFGLPIYYDLVADDAEKAEIRTLAAGLTDYIADNGYRLLNENGKVTTYGNLDPEWVNGVYGRQGDQGLNSAAALAMVRATFNITGNAKYLGEYRALIDKHHYDKNAQREKEISDRYQVNHDSDEMAALAFYSLIRTENSDAKLRDDFYIEGMRRLWKTDLKERNAEQIMVYGAFAKKDFALDLAVRSLREIPLDLVKHDVINSRRKDVTISLKADRFFGQQGTFVLPFTEVRTVRWSQNLYTLDVEDGGTSEDVPTFWLLPYWMARFHGLIRSAAK